jgi:hypothetical protein
MEVRSGEAREGRGEGVEVINFRKDAKYVPIQYQALDCLLIFINEIMHVMCEYKRKYRGGRKEEGGRGI